ncbi:hypothetical protein ABT263_14640 [Kitasatospora sp. NPDC001603]|uniref:hypothetical protein n=1 Tax=Kitasatospora sp. NPDC001603 TaxID=3154388 RepID=UPI00332EECB7
MAGTAPAAPAARAVQVVVEAVVEDERVNKDVLVTLAEVLAAAHTAPASPDGGIST